MEEHWQGGYSDASSSLLHPEILQRPNNLGGIHIFDFNERERD
jgi:hypothetical protein